MMESDKTKLMQHLLGQHDDLKAGWLKMGCTPSLLTDSSLWDQFLEYPSKGFKPSALGRPKKRDQKHEDKSKRLRLADEVLAPEEGPAPQDDVVKRLKALSSELRRTKRSEALLKDKLAESEETLKAREKFAKRTQAKFKEREEENLSLIHI